jgi:hypothetical protein
MVILVPGTDQDLPVSPVRRTLARNFLADITRQAMELFMRGTQIGGYIDASLPEHTPLL